LEVRDRKVRVLGHSLSDYLKGRGGSLGIHPRLHSFTTTIARAATMASPRSDEVKQVVNKPMEEEKPLPLSMSASEEVWWCELKPKLEIKRTAHIHCGGRVRTEKITSHRPIKKEKFAAPMRRSERLLSMKRKNYKEKMPEPKDKGE
jgi:hypothetical protein